MERFTNDRNQFVEAIENELMEYEKQKDFEHLFTYVEVPFFLRYAFSYALWFDKNNSKYFLKRKEWNAKYDHSRFDKGIYNLDRLAIIENEVSLNDTDRAYFDKVEWTLLNTIDFEGIVLDGLTCKLRIGKENKTLVWNPDSKMNNKLKELVYLIRNWKRKFDDFK
ncbi:hypothetical protein [Bernardetia sp.]|uniref:hypothetical protein n=1 Tax=Bernardetia sp. TaxID=1937974 RepID=UPI0025BEC2D6|nr:hypothetical protein [Bernardetia sp.]